LFLKRCSRRKCGKGEAKKNPQAKRGQSRGTPRSQLRKFEKELLAKGWREVREGIEVKLAP
jgi:hypothetical protein